MKDKKVLNAGLVTVFKFEKNIKKNNPRAYKTKTNHTKKKGFCSEK